MQSQEITLEDLYKMVEELSKEGQATQKSLAAVRGEITNLYSLWKSHRCWISSD